MFLYFDRYNCNIVFILCLSVLFVARFFGHTVLRIDPYHASTSPDIAKYIGNIVV